MHFLTVFCFCCVFITHSFVWGGDLECRAPSKFDQSLQAYCEIKFEKFHCKEFVEKNPEYKEDVVDCRNSSAMQPDLHGQNFSIEKCQSVFKEAWSDFFSDVNDFFHLPGQPKVVSYGLMKRARPTLGGQKIYISASQQMEDFPTESGFDRSSLTFQNLKEALLRELENQGIRLVCLSPEKQLEIGCYGLAAAVNPAKPLQVLQVVRKSKTAASSAAKVAKVVSAGKKVGLESLQGASVLSKLKLSSPMKAKFQLDAGEAMIKNEKIMEESLKKMSFAELTDEVKISMEVARRENGYLPGLSPDWQPRDVGHLIENYESNPKGSFLKNMTGNLSSYAGFRDLLVGAEKKDKIDDHTKKWIQLWEDKVWNAKVFEELERRIQKGVT